ncbi:MAG: hypothetical protein A2W61_03015 [Deltaproteobacteria bacterium RIFCSPLOWO2_01_44_7]|nr:MAG: hypothetical protein A2712_02495 [Deltaproteobacteria bacterium RIFCSPHIGHO2_01_FULL_43_49]OGQ16065.1 MAG: hypothetical protein A3D22_00465 [Deltaproteobacteria bacterium RIFCSPHIGHO2_02_FULL_44_53]OGQ29026.1 MAG: hypothetical protein A3D98_04250 [Deltaproteobacteria bacterium RIFCSPHIGHO2_12_FULL_44_21]OGQ32582.1 MAG: hypothetical protein A2979_08395 [Deltaproteobacteria bacterium RIFCSPLOWO2_01_FULL_45_74]OGQ38324.1 MAG: hypothetical protein A2W61_03015 [Deltaproteobacteria bacterium 
MKYRKLGKTGLVVSEIGFGAWGIGGTHGDSIAYGATDDKESLLALQLAYDLGITFYDTADFYGFGHSETLIGKALKSVRQKIVIATKVGLLSKAGDRDFSPKHILQSIEKSLKRLKTDVIDLYQLHSPSMEELVKNQDLFVILGRLKKEGKVRAIGLSARSPQEALQMAQAFAFQVLQVNFNLVDQRAQVEGLFDFCLKKDIGMIVRTPLCFGFLSGEYSPGGSYESGDHRGLWPLEQRKKWHEAVHLFLKAVGNGNDQTKTQLALRFCLSPRAVSTVIPGMLNRQQVQENVRASDFGRLKASENKKIEEIYRQNCFFVERCVQE